MIRKLLAAVLAAVALSGLSPACRRRSGGGRTTPTVAYYNAFGSFYDGDYLDALKAFQAEVRSSIKTSQSRWIDSICYETMCGECYFQMGVFDQALLHYTNALQLYKRFPDWMMKVQFEPTIRAAAASARKAVPWGVSHAAIPSWATIPRPS